MIPAVVKILAFLTIVGQVTIVALLLLRKTVKKTVNRYAYHLVFSATLFATLGSLFFSEIAKFPPCALCWYQRIFIYPQPVMLYIALMREERTLSPYLLTLNILGAIIAIYHYLIQRFPAASVLNCQIGSISCTKASFYFGYVSIPLMALTVFLFNIVIFLFFSKKTRHA